MKIIIIGCGKVGSALAEELTMENHEVAIVDISAQKLQEVGEDLDALQIHGNGSSINVLMDAGVTSADLVIAVTGSDELNLLCCLVAKNLGKCHTVARVRNPIYYKQIDFLKKDLHLQQGNQSDERESWHFHDHQPGDGNCCRDRTAASLSFGH